MAALQKIRSHGAWLIVIIGLGLFAFIAEDAFRMIETLWNGSRTQVGVVAGNSLSIQDYNEDVEMLTETYKVRKAQNGDTDPITDEQNEEIRRQVWSQFVRSTIIAEQAEKFGLFVSEEEEQEALREGRAQALQDLAPYFGSAQGMINFSALQQFINEKDQNIMQAQQAGRSDIVEDIQRVYRIWQYAERNLRKELLENKFYAFLYQAASANPVLAKFEYDANAEQAVAEVVGVPYSSVTDKEVKVSDEDLKEVYEANKKLFKQDEETRDLRVIDIHVLPSAADVESINSEMNAVYARLQGEEEPASVVAAAQSDVAYTNLPLGIEVFRKNAPEVANLLDTVAVGSVRAPFTTGEPGNEYISTFKLISRAQQPDSIQFRQIFAVAETPEASEVLADSIADAIKGGASFKDLAKKYRNQSGDSAWVVPSRDFEKANLSDDNVKLFSALYNAPLGEVQVVKTSQGSLVLQVVARTDYKTKYNVAVVRRPVKFTDKTYNAELNKLNRFLSENKTIEAIEKNAAKAGVLVRKITLSANSNIPDINNRYIANTREVMRWIFDEAGEGDVSSLYQVGNANHLLVVGVAGINKPGFQPLESDNVKQFVTRLATQKKKGEYLMERMKDVNDVAAAKAQRGAVIDSCKNVTFASNPQVQMIGVGEPKLAAAISKTAVGKSTGKVQGAAAVYVAQVLSKTKSETPYDEKAALVQMQQGNMQSFLRQSFYGQPTEVLVNALIYKAKIEDNRYKF